MIRPLLRFSILCLCLVGLVVGGMAAEPALALTNEQNLVAEVWRIVNRAYVDETFNHQNWWFTRQRALERPLDSRADTYQAIQDMLAGLDDPYTRLLPPNQYRSLQTSTAGELTGVGLQISKDEHPGWLRIIAPIEGSPAEQAGIHPKDVVLEIDGTATTDLTLDEAAARMRGREGTTVTLQLRGPDETAPHQVSLKRELITLNPVVAALKTTPAGQQVGYLRLSQFNGNAVSKLMDAVRDQARQGAEGYILDLRNNPGGLL
ncbi:MAG: PDZ domain-containing protein, partial [Nodosilinea sp.]